MRVLILEDNLMWGARLAQTVRGLGHEAVLLDKPLADWEGDVAIVNLGSDRLRADELVPALHAAGVYVIGHAGHKERPLLQFGRESGCDQVVSNSTLTFKLDELLATVSASRQA